MGTGLDIVDAIKPSGQIVRPHIYEESDSHRGPPNPNYPSYSEPEA